LSAESLALMRQPTLAADTIGTYEAVGLVWFLRQFQGVTLVNHGGATNGQIAGLTLVPKKDFAVAVLTNANDGGLITRAVTNTALEHYLDLREDEPETIAVEASDLAAYSGCYTSQIADVDAVTEQGRLVLHVRPKGTSHTKTRGPRPRRRPRRCASSP
jgi:hypothetical protein